MMQIKNFWLLLLFAFCAVQAQQYNFRQYNVQDGLAHSQVSTILQDRKGYVWFATYGGGISRFDGKTFVNYTEKEGLPCNIIRPMIEGKDGKLWMGTMGAGVCWFDGKKFGVLKDSGTKINEKVYTIIQSHDGTIWFGADNGLYSYDGKHVKHYTEKDGFPEVPVMSVYEDKRGDIWSALWEHGVYRCSWQGRYATNFSEKDGLGYHTQMCFNEDEEGDLWISGFKGTTRVHRQPEGSLQFFKDTSRYLSDGLVYMMTDDKKGNLWFASTDHGIIRYNKKEKKYSQISTRNGLPGDVILTLLCDAEGNLWASTWGFGAVMLQGERFVHYTQKDGLGSDLVTHVIKDPRGGLIINTSAGIYRYDKKNGIRIFDKQLENFHAMAMAMDDKGTLWLGDKNALYSFSAGKFKKYEKKDGLAAVPVTYILCEGNNVWAGSWSGGLSRFDGSTFRNFSGTDGLSSPYIYTIVKGKKGEIYIGTWDGGLNVYDGKKFVVYKKEQGLPSNNVISILESKKHIWVGTFGGGICRFDGKHIISAKNGLSDDAVVALAIDENDDLYIAGSKGLNKLDVKDYDEFYKTNPTARFRFYGKEEGFSGIECSHNAAVCDEDVNLWFGTKKGLTKFDITKDSINKGFIHTYITDVRLFFEKADWKKFADSTNASSGLPVDPVFDYKNNHITFNFQAINTTCPEKVRYSYMLRGADLAFSPLTDKNEVTYSGLAPGEYTFELEAYNEDGVGNPYGCNPGFHFRIEAPFWRRTWFYALCIISAVCGIVLYGKWQTKKLAKTNRILEEKVTERTSEIEKQKEVIEQKNRDITDSINYAKRIQYTLLANEELLKENIKEHFIFFQPKDIVSGDFYWAANKNGKFYLAVCDSTGHGVPGAFMSLMNISFLNEAISEKNISEPHEILNYVRQRLIASVSKDGAQDGMDGILLCIDKENEMVSYAAGQNRPVMISENRLIQLEADKMPIGKGERSSSFTLFRLEMKPGDMLYLYTDGYADQFGGKDGKKFKYRQLQELLLKHHDEPMEKQQRIYEEAINQWKGNLEQIDDILLIGIRI
jgi:ligand-binding sensor domain-containing protein/serine phosphatase RsbU (regulator of sigma subunit)